MPLLALTLYFLVLLFPMSLLALSYGGRSLWKQTWKPQVALSLLGSGLTVIWDFVLMPYLRSR